MRSLETQTNETPTLSAKKAVENESIFKTAESLSKSFSLFAALQFITIVGGAIFGLLVAPASLFVSRTENEAFGWIAVAVAAAIFAALALIAFPLALIAAFATKRAKSYGRICGIVAACSALLQFPLGTIFGVVLLRKIFRCPQLTGRTN